MIYLCVFITYLCFFMIYLCVFITYLCFFMIYLCLSAESTETKTHTVDIQVQRIRGKFGTVSVIWTLSRGAGDDLTPTTGKLTFYPGESLKLITLESKQDDVSVYVTFTLHSTLTSSIAHLTVLIHYSKDSNSWSLNNCVRRFSLPLTAKY